MGTRIPPSLDFLVIYNKSLTALPETVPDDDDDAQEEAHILFYTCRQRAVTRDRTLRQVGLAKALASFSEQVQEDWFPNLRPLLTYNRMFNGNGSGTGATGAAIGAATGAATGAGYGYETVHSMKSRLVMVTPEEHYTIHAVGLSIGANTNTAHHPPTQSVDLAYTSWTHKGKDGKTETRYQYHEDSLHDSVLRLGLLNAYDEFKVCLSPLASLASLHSCDTNSSYMALSNPYYPKGETFYSTS